MYTVHSKCIFCHEFCSRIAGGSTIDFSDSLLDLISSWSEDYIDIALCDGSYIPSVSIVPIISFESENDESDSNLNSESDGLESLYCRLSYSKNYIYYYYFVIIWSINITKYFIKGYNSILISELLLIRK